MSSMTGPVGQWALGILAALATMVVAYFALPRMLKFARGLGWWLLAVAVLGLAVAFLVVLPRKFPSTSFPDSALPLAFRGGYWTWLLLFLLVAAGSALAYGQTLLRRRREGGPAQAEAPWPELDAAWQEVLVRLEHAGIDPADQRFYLLIAPEAPNAQALAHSAGLQVFVEAPEGPAPLRAFATSEGVLLDCAGASALGGTQPGRIDALARKLAALRPDCPGLGGVIVLLPIEWASRPESVINAAAIRDDLAALRRTLQLNPPVFALVSGMESVPGFLEFVGRLAAQVAPQMVDQRVGFAIPATESFSGDLIQRGFTWMSGWFDSWTLNLLAGDPLDDAGNGRLVLLDQEIRRYRKRLRALLESAFSTHRGAESILFRGCYFVATGPNREDRAFTAGLLRGPRSRIIADHLATDWSEEADRQDRHYRRLALAVAILGGAGCLGAWMAIISRTPLAWAGLGAIGIAWAAALLKITRA